MSIGPPPPSLSSRSFPGKEAQGCQLDGLPGVLQPFPDLEDQILKLLIISSA